MIADLREQLAADLAVLGVPVLAAWPDRITPPCLMLTPPSGAYVTGGPTFGGYTVNVDVVCLVGKAAPALALQSLETLIEGVLQNSADFGLSGVDSPSIVTVNGADCLGSIVHLAKPARLNT